MTRFAHDNGQGDPRELLDRVPPSNLDAEKGVLGSILLQPAQLERVAAVVASSSYFYRAAHQTIYRAILDQAEDGGIASIDVVTIAHRLFAATTFDEASGAQYLGELLSSVPHAANAEWYAHIVAEQYERRRHVALSLEQVRDAYDQGQPICETRGKLTRALEAIESANGQATAKLPTLADLMSAADQAETPWRVDGLIAPGWLAVMGGMGKRTGKTTLSVHLAVALTLGRHFLGRETRRCPVVILDYENARGYLASLFRGAAGDAIATVADHCRVVTRDLPDYPHLPPWPLTAERLRGLLRPLGEPGVVVIDSARGAFGWTDEQENDAGVVGPLLRGLQTVARKTGWTILVIHHANKDRTGPNSLSGSTEWTAAPDLILTLSPRRENGERRVLMEVDGRLPAVESTLLEVTPQGVTVCGTPQQLADIDAETKVEGALGPAPGDEHSAIAERAEMAKTTAYRALQRLVAAGHAGRSGEGKKGDPFLYFSRLRDPP